MSLVFSCIVPHPPIIIPEIGKEEIKKVKKTITALKNLEKDFIENESDTALIISPHAPLLPESFSISKTQKLSGNFFNFGDFETSLKFDCDTDIAQKIANEAFKENTPVELINNKELDHGALVPLYYLAQKRNNLKLVLMNFSFNSLKSHFKYGQIIRDAIDNEKNKKIVVIASGDLSHRITEDAPAGFHPGGAKFDKELIQLLEKKQVNKILDLNPVYIKNAGECGLRSIVILLGILSKTKYKINILSYEAPFGVGYMVANFILNN